MGIFYSLLGGKRKKRCTMCDCILYDDSDSDICECCLSDMNDDSEED